MESGYYYSVFAIFSATLISFALTFHAWRIRTSFLVKMSYVVFMGAITVWAFGYGMELTAQTLQAKLFWANIKYIGLLLAPIAFFVFAAYFTQKEKWVKKPGLTLLGIYYVIVLVIILTSQYHGLFRQNVVLETEPSLHLEYDPGIFFYLQGLISSLVYLLASILLFSHLFEARKIYRKQVVFLFPSILIPWVSIILDTTTPHLFRYLSTSVFAFVLSGLLFILANPDDQSFIFNNLKNGIIFLNLKHEIVDSNNKAREYLFPEIKKWGDISIYNVLPELKEKNLEANEDVTFEIQRDYAGEKSFYELSITRVRHWDDPFLNGHLIVVHDISDKKFTENAFLNSQGKLKALFDSQLVAIASLDLEGNYTQVNERWAEISGYSPEEVQGQSYLKFTHPDDQTGCRRKFSEMRQGKLDTRQVERRILRKDGEVFWAYLSISPILDNEGKTIAFSEVMVDVTEYVKVQQALRESEEKYRGVSERANDGIVIVQDEVLKYTNPQIEEILGYSRQELDGKHYSELLAPRYTEALMERYGKRMRGEPVPDRYEAELKDRNGNEITVEINAGLMELEGRPADLILIRDITQRKQYEKELKEKNLALERSIEQANQLRNLAERRATEMETLREAGGVVNTVLNKEEMIALVLEQLARVVPYDGASVQLLQKNCLQLVGYRGFNPAEKIMGMKLPLDSTNPGCEVIKKKKTIILEEVFEKYKNFQNPQNKEIESWLGVPLLIQDEVIGLLTLDSKEAGHFNQEQARLAAAFANQVAIALENARLFDEVQRLAITDPLTGLYNRRHYYALTLKEFERNKRYNVPFSILMLDIDHFKKVNDTYGHLVGDLVLKELADMICNNLRGIDIPCRYGGEEFVVTLPETNLKSALQLAERLRKLVKNTQIETENGPVSMTISIGVAEFGGGCQDIETLLGCADTALYQAKALGRNKVMAYQG